MGKGPTIYLSQAIVDKAHIETDGNLAAGVAAAQRGIQHLPGRIVSELSDLGAQEVLDGVGLSLLELQQRACALAEQFQEEGRASDLAKINELRTALLSGTATSAQIQEVLRLVGRTE